MLLNALALSGLSTEHQLLFTRFSCGDLRETPFLCVHQAFEFHANAQPSAIAVEHIGEVITYADLNHQANGLAQGLRSLGVRPGSRVCLLVQRSIPMVIGILGILKAGGQYVPLDGGIVTQSTLDFVLEDSNSSVILTLQEFSHRLSENAGRPIVVLETAIERIRNEKRDPSKPLDLSSPNDGVYVIYTSGTTGKPKGVDVLHRNVTNLVCLEPGSIGMSPGMRVSQLLNVAFDMCAWEILGSLANGCTLCVRGKTSKDWRSVMKTVDIIIATPSILAPHDPKDYPNVKYVATAGEVCPQGLADRWSQSAQFYNCCGPTEITIINTIQPHVSGTILSIGRPTPNNTVYITDENMSPVPVGQKGIMWAGGAGITRGYINLPQNTTERYKRDPFLNDGSLMFNTGDLGRWRPDGELEHLGRVDDQVKVKGFRVELDGVAAAMEACTRVRAAVALLIGDEIWGFFTPEVDIENVKVATAKIQPYYAVPNQFYPLAEFPQTTNGKTDKRALRQLALEKTAKIKEANILRPSRRANDNVKLGGEPPRLWIGAPSRNIWPIATSLPVVPPPVYRKDADGLDVSCVPSDSSVTTLHSPVDEKVNVSAVEKGHTIGWEGYEDDPLPDKTQGHYMRNLRHQIFTLYRRLFGIVFVANMIIFVITIAKDAFNAQHLGLVVVSNLFCSIALRQCYVINAFFNVFCAVPTSWPISIRRVCARVYHIGGLHTGCAISGIVWLMFFTVQATVEFARGGKCSIATVVVTYWILLLLLSIATFAYPKFRLIAHDQFERTHRFFGWAAVVLVWCQVVLLTNDYRERGQILGHALIESPPFWLVIILTVSIILPWIRLRKVPVRAEVLSKHAVRLYFDYVTPVPGTSTRISESPLLEWHGFATVPEPGMKGYSLVVSRAGDWTSKQIENPPSELWVRGVPTCGVLRIVPLFRRVVFVATGSGIGPCAPCILERRVPIQLLWTSPNVRETFGDKLVDSILNASPGAVIYDTRTHGKPDMVKLTYRLVREFKAEAVCIISNQKLTRKVVYGMMSRGIPAFGAIWDS
ncbi:nonribosomal peptide synthetase 12 [Phellopilus nigrolimitatus]|nr:nonribosomal peptide synthetase 12 [Phellopilus nigrolimitatus]